MARPDVYVTPADGSTVDDAAFWMTRKRAGKSVFYNVTVSLS